VERLGISSGIITFTERIKAMDTTSLDRTFVKKGKLKQQGNDFLYWQTQPYLVRLAVMEEIRNEYNRWKYGTEQGFQRVYRIVKRK